MTPVSPQMEDQPMYPTFANFKKELKNIGKAEILAFLMGHGKNLTRPKNLISPWKKAGQLKNKKAAKNQTPKTHQPQKTITVPLYRPHYSLVMPDALESVHAILKHKPEPPAATLSRNKLIVRLLKYKPVQYGGKLISNKSWAKLANSQIQKIQLMNVQHLFDNARTLTPDLTISRHKMKLLPLAERLKVLRIQDLKDETKIGRLPTNNVQVDLATWRQHSADTDKPSGKYRDSADLLEYATKNDKVLMSLDREEKESVRLGKSVTRLELKDKIIELNSNKVAKYKALIAVQDVVRNWPKSTVKNSAKMLPEIEIMARA